jgi:O-antigen/teichoic acid export membrane protein
MFASGILLAVMAYRPMQNAWGASWLSASWDTLRGRRREILRYLLWTNFSELLGLVVKQLDLVMLGYFRGPQDVGCYKLAKSVSALVGHVASPLETVAYPRLAALAGAHRQMEVRQVVRTFAFRVGLPAGLVACFGLWLVPWVLPRVAGSSFVSAVRPAQLLLACSVVWLTCFWLRPLYFAQGAMKTWTLMSGAMIGVSLVGLPICAYWWGGVGMAAWQLGMTIFSYGLFVLLSVRHFRTRPALSMASTNACALLG